MGNTVNRNTLKSRALRARRKDEGLVRAPDAWILPREIDRYNLFIDSLKFDREQKDAKAAAARAKR